MWTKSEDVADDALSADTVVTGVGGDKDVEGYRDCAFACSNNFLMTEIFLLCDETCKLLRRVLADA